MSSFLSKIELKYQLQRMGIKVEGNYVKKGDIEKILGARSVKNQFEALASKESLLTEFEKAFKETNFSETLKTTLLKLIKGLKLNKKEQQVIKDFVREHRNKVKYDYWESFYHELYYGFEVNEEEKELLLNMLKEKKDEVKENCSHPYPMDEFKQETELRKLVKSIYNWVVNEDPDELDNLYQAKYPVQYKKAGILYRGHALSKKEWLDLQSGKKLKIDRGSWTSNKDTAIRFAFDSSAEIRVVLEIKPESKDIVVNLIQFIRSKEVNKELKDFSKENSCGVHLDHFYDIIDLEDEVLVKSIYVTKKNILGNFTKRS